MAYRVIQWSTGNVGRYALRGIIGHPDLELAGVWVSSDAKAGRDAGELCGIDPVGVVATTDADALLKLDADCVCYTATADLRPFEAVNDLVRILDSGKNVVMSSLVQIVYPAGGPREITEPLQAACERGGASCFTSGIDPGFANDVLPIVLASVAERVDEIRVQEVLNYATYDQPEVLFTTMGFGGSLDATPVLLLPRILQMAWGSVLHAIAASLGTRVTDVRETYERRPAPDTFEVPSGKVEEGTQAALRFELIASTERGPRIVVEHVTRLRADLAPDWPQPPGVGGYRVIVEGMPRMNLELTLAGDGGDENAGGLIVTAMRLVNAIPAVCEAPPGLLSALDLPIALGALPGRE